jgi:hypothetical protein
MSDDELIEYFESGQEPAGGFHHREHVRVAWAYLRRGALPVALAPIPSRFAALRGGARQARAGPRDDYDRLRAADPRAYDEPAHVARVRRSESGFAPVVAVESRPLLPVGDALIRSGATGVRDTGRGARECGTDAICAGIRCGIVPRVGVNGELRQRRLGLTGHSSGGRADWSPALACVPSSCRPSCQGTSPARMATVLALSAV